VIEAFGAVLPVAVAMALSPVPIIAVLLVLLAPTGRAAGLCFAVGRLLGVAGVVGVFAVLSDGVELTDAGAPVVAVLRLLVGVTLMVLAAAKWRGRARSAEEATLPGWMGAIEGSSPARALWVAILVSVANPKELLLGVGAGLTIGSTGLPLGATLAVGAAYTAIACVSVVGPVVAFVAAPDSMRGRLQRLRLGLVRHNDAIMSVVLLVIGAALIGGGLSDF